MKGSTWLNGLLLVAVAGVFALNWAIERDTGRPNYEFLPGMLYAVPAESFTASPLFDDGVAMRPPPVGTIPHGWMPVHYEATPEEAERAGRELVNPYPKSELGAVDRGEEVFGIYCRLCHGGGGEGDGVVAQRGFPTPPSLLAPNARHMADGRLFHVITYGQGNMPGHATQIDLADRWKAILFVRRLQAETPPIEVDPGAPETGDTSALSTSQAAQASQASGGAARPDEEAGR